MLHYCACVRGWVLRHKHTHVPSDALHTHASGATALSDDTCTTLTMCIVLSYSWTFCNSTCVIIILSWYYRSFISRTRRLVVIIRRVYFVVARCGASDDARSLSPPLLHLLPHCIVHNFDTAKLWWHFRSCTLLYSAFCTVFVSCLNHSVNVVLRSRTESGCSIRLPFIGNYSGAVLLPAIMSVTSVLRFSA